MIDRKASDLSRFRSCMLLEPLIKQQAVNLIAVPLRLVRSGRTCFSRDAREGSVETHIGLLKWRPAQADHRVLSEWSAIRTLGFDLRCRTNSLPNRHSRLNLGRRKRHGWSRTRAPSLERTGLPQPLPPEKGERQSPAGGSVLLS